MTSSRGNSDLAGLGYKYAVQNYRPVAGCLVNQGRGDFKIGTRPDGAVDIAIVPIEGRGWA